MIGSTHNHSTGSDGKLSPEEIVRKAIKLKWDYFYFTDHYPNPSDSGVQYNDQGFFNKQYRDEVKKLQQKYKEKIKVYFGAEFSWLKGYPDYLREASKIEKFDYIIGAIHDMIDKNKIAHSIESGKEKWMLSAKQFGGIEGFVKEYYKQLRSIIKSRLFDSVGHLDYIKVYNKQSDLFSEKADWYVKQVLETLDLIKKYNVALEINQSGIRKCGEQFPSIWIIKQAKKMNIPVTLALDVHWKEHLNNKYLKEIINVAKKVGYKETVRFEKRRMLREKLP